MASVLPNDLHTRFFDDGDLLNDPMSEYFEADYRMSSKSQFLPFRPPASPICYTPTLSSRSSDADADADTDTDEIVLPAFEAEEIPHDDQRVFSQSDSSTPKTTAALANALNEGLDPLVRTSSDDASIESEPERHVDYLSHDWREEDIWSSWRYVVSRRDRYSNGVRLENASWRTWAKSKYRLRTVSPETLNWLKDCDVTWLYGPLQTDIKSLPHKPPPSGLSSSNSFLDRKSILKKKTASEAILQRSLSQHTLLKHAGAILQAQKAQHSWGKHSFADNIGRMLDTPSESASSGLASPSERRHIHFNNEVVQCIAVEAKDYYEELDVDPSLFFLGEELDDDYDGFDEDEDNGEYDDDDGSDEGVVMMKRVNSRSSTASTSSSSSAATLPPNFRNPSRNSSFNESKTIAPLPPTTLKCRSDTPEPAWNHEDAPRGNASLSPTPSVETLRPSRPEANFLLDGGDDDNNDDYTKPQVDSQWRFSPSPSPSPPPKRNSLNGKTRNDTFDRPWFVNSEDREELDGDGNNLHLTPSGMFMPYEEEDSYKGVFGRVIDTVNTARDIAHVIWNVGWRK